MIGVNGKFASPVGIHYSGIWLTDPFSNPQRNHTLPLVRVLIRFNPEAETGARREEDDWRAVSRREGNFKWF